MRKVSRLVFIFTSVEHNFLCLFSWATKHLSFPFHFSRSIPSFSERARDLSTIIANRHPIHSHVKRDDDGVAFTWALCHWFSCFCTKYEKPVSQVSLAPWHSETVNEQAQSGWNGWRAGSGLTGGASESVMRRWNNTLAYVLINIMLLFTSEGMCRECQHVYLLRIITYELWNVWTRRSHWTCQLSHRLFFVVRCPTVIVRVRFAAAM